MKTTEQNKTAPKLTKACGIQTTTPWARTCLHVTPDLRDEGGSYVAVKLDCGHELKCNPIYSYRVGDSHRCHVCIGDPALKDGAK